MRHPSSVEAFDTSAALAVLDGIVHRTSAPLTPSAGPAWESAWIACLTNSARWAETARREFGAVLQELEAADPFGPRGLPA